MTQPDAAPEEEVLVEPLPALEEPPAAPKRTTYPFTRANGDSRQLAREFSAALGREVEVNYLTPGQKGVDPVLWITDVATGEDVAPPPAEVDRLLKAHVPPPPPEAPDARRARLRSQADAATSVAALRAVVKEIIDRVG